MKIAFVAQPFDLMTPPVRAGSVALWIYCMARRLVALGHQVTIISNNGTRLRTRVMEHEEVRYILTPTLVDAQINRIGRHLAKLTGSMQTGWHHLRFGALAARAAAAEQADVVHIMNYSELVPRIRRQNPGAVIALHMHCEWLTQLPREIIADRIQHADLIVGCSQYITNLIAARFPEYADRCVAVPNATDVVPEDQIASSSEHRIVFVGRLSPEKGVHDLIVAFRILLERFPNATLHLIGGFGSLRPDYLVELSDDPDVKALRRFYAARGTRASNASYRRSLKKLAGPELGRRIFFEGHVERDAIQDRYRNAALLVNPSLSESFGIPIIEAMMMQLPVVATRVGGAQHIVADGETGLLVAPAAPAALAQAIGVVLADAELARRLGEAGRARALEHFSWDRALTQLVDAYAGVPKRSVQG